MDSCQLCKMPIVGSYYRIGRVMSCEGCSARVLSNEQALRSKRFKRGLLFAGGGALLAMVMKFVVDFLLSLVDLGGFSLPAAWVRGGTTLAMGGMIVAAARAGAENRGSRGLQVCAVILTYLAYAVSLALLVVSKVPTARISAVYVCGFLVVAPILPFLLVFKNPIAISGLVVLAMAMFGVWEGTEEKILVDGPYGAKDAYAEKPMFGTLS